MFGQWRIADRSTVLLWLGLFLLWNWRLASVTALNPEHIDRTEWLQLFGWKSAFFIALSLCLFAVFRKMRPTLLGVACFIVFWLLGGNLVAAVYAFDLLSFVLRLVMLGGAILLVSYAIIKSFNMTALATAIYGGVVVGMQAPGVFSVLSTHSLNQPLSGFEVDLDAISNETRADEHLPHIIYIVPDRYASNENLRSLYEYSNAPFTSELQARGFHVWDDQYANYPKTFMSLASTLNADYLDPLTQRISRTSTSYSYLNPSIRDFAARRALQARGYSYTHVGAWWTPTKMNPLADRNFSDHRVPYGQLTQVYMRYTPLVFLLAQAEAQRTACKVIDEKVEFIREQVQSDRPQFVFWHTLLTHDPYIFEDDGSCRSEKTDRIFARDYERRKQAYLNHIEHFNRISLDLIDSVFQNSTRDVILVIQSDEGPYPESLILASNDLTPSSYNFLAAPRMEKQRKHGVFNAIYLPSQDYEAARDLRSPVNNFRLIFRELTDQPVRLLPDRVYSFEVDHQPYDLTDISRDLELNE
ncbi:MAG: sulfatase-like hydrolase/transferase [Pseudomonadota bacterium]